GGTLVTDPPLTLAASADTEVLGQPCLHTAGASYSICRGGFQKGCRRNNRSAFGAAPNANRTDILDQTSGLICAPRQEAHLERALTQTFRSERSEAPTTSKHA